MLALFQALEGKIDKFMDVTIKEAKKKGLEEGGIPIGSVLVHKGKIIGRGHNRRVQKGSAILHGEMGALENAGRLPGAVYLKAFFTLHHLHVQCVQVLFYFTGYPK